MTVADTGSQWSYAADGVNCQFAYTGLIFASSDLHVYVGGALQSTGYTVSGAGSSSGGTVTFTTPPADDSCVTLVRAVPYTQTTDLPESGRFPSTSVERMSDKLTVLVQQIKATFERVFKLAEGSCVTGLTVPPFECGKFLMAETTSVSWATPANFTASLPLSPANGGTGGDNQTGVAYASLPAAGTAGRLRRVTDFLRGLFLDTGTVWTPVNPNTVDAALFGVQAGTTTDQGPNIQAAYDASCGREVILPAGIIRVATNIIVPATHAQELNSTTGWGPRFAGQGMHTTVIDWRGSCGCFFVMGPGEVGMAADAGKYFFGASFRDLRITSGSAAAGGRGIDLKNVWYLTTERVQIDHMGCDGILVLNKYGDGDSSSNLRFRQTEIRNNGGWGVNCAADPTVLTLGLISIEDSQVQYNARGGIKFSGVQFRTSLVSVGLNGRGVTDAVTTAGSKTLTSATAAFTSEDTCVPVTVIGAGATGRSVADGVVVANDATVTSASAAWVAGTIYAPAPGDVGAVVVLVGAGPGGLDHVTTIASRTSATDIELSEVPATSVNPCTIRIGVAPLVTKIGAVVSPTQVTLMDPASTAVNQRARLAISGGIWVKNNTGGSRTIRIDQTEFETNAAFQVAVDAGVSLSVSQPSFQHSCSGPWGFYAPVRGMLLGDNSGSALNIVDVEKPVIRSTPSPSFYPATAFDIKANATYPRIERPIWTGQMHRWADAGTESDLRDDVRGSQIVTAVAAGGTYTPDLTMGDIHRVSFSGNAEILAPTGTGGVPVPGGGHLIVFSFFNSTGGGIILRFNCGTGGYRMDGRPSPGASRRVTGRFWYDTGSGAWMQLGAWSCDING